MQLRAPVIKMNDGRAMPALGLGVWKAEPAECYQAVRWALEAGYRHIDTARVYGNERDVGRAIRDSGVPRGEIFVTTKLWNADQGFDEAHRACGKSLKDLDLEYVDLYLIHFPVTRTRSESWRALEALQASGRALSIGVSNFTETHLDELLEGAKVVPAVNQVEFHPFLYQRELLAYCKAKGIVLQAYSPLAHGTRVHDGRVVDIAEERGVTPAQTLIAWGLAKGCAVLPKSVRQERIVENFEAVSVELSDDEVAALDRLNEGLRTCWDPSDVP